MAFPSPFLTPVFASLGGEGFVPDLLSYELARAEFAPGAGFRCAAPRRLASASQTFKAAWGSLSAFCLVSPHNQRPTPSDISKNAPSLQGLSHAGVARSRRRMISAMNPTNPHQTFNNVTTPYLPIQAYRQDMPAECRGHKVTLPRPTEFRRWQTAHQNCV
jgi:hypothetical protein